MTRLAVDAIGRTCEVGNLWAFFRRRAGPGVTNGFNDAQKSRARSPAPCHSIPTVTELRRRSNVKEWPENWTAKQGQDYLNQPHVKYLCLWRKL
jgi:hypothetical protein